MTKKKQTAADFTRSWIADVRFEGKETFRFGTIQCPLNATNDEVTEKMRGYLARFYPEDGMKIVRCAPGVVYVVLGDNLSGNPKVESVEMS